MLRSRVTKILISAVAAVLEGTTPKSIRLLWNGGGGDDDGAIMIMRLYDDINNENLSMHQEA